MRIAVFDDNESDRKHLLSLIHSWVKLHKPAISAVFDYSKAGPLLSEISEGRFFDLYFLDIMTKESESTGYRLAETIRHYDSGAVIVFTTNSTKYTASAYEISAFRYLQKPISQNQICTILDNVSASLMAIHSSTVVFHGIKETRVFQHSEIVYIEAQTIHHRAYVYTSNGEKTEISISRIPFSSLVKNHLSDLFCQCHRGYIVNLSYVTGYDKEHVKLGTNALIPLSRDRKQSFIQAFIQFHKRMN